MLFIHNKDHALLDFSDAFGGTYLTVPTGWRRNASSKVQTYITYALKVEIFNKIETEENVCQEMPQGEAFDMERCLAGFYARVINCTSPWEKDLDSTETPRCNTTSQYKGTEMLKKKGSRLRELTLAARMNAGSHNQLPDFLKTAC